MLLPPVIMASWLHIQGSAAALCFKPLKQPEIRGEQMDFTTGIYSETEICYQQWDRIVSYEKVL
jgi:hypothetical protein